ncbi:alpha/beta fold hydrolase [Streptomyces canus]|uniref:alpha/beta fold hydrolase n=1 Tax=Streptomyces canus TaxID=58343 RepID=UPI003863DB00
MLLLHGHPRTHATWHRVAPLPAASGHTVVCPDLRGYGRSDKPATDPEHRPYSKRAMAGDCLAVMRRLGHERFTVVGHDRGAYVATRLALDHPGAVSAVSVLDAVPIGELVALVLPRPDGQARRTRPQRRPRRLVRGHSRADGRRGLQGLPARDPRPGHRARHVRGLPGRPAHQQPAPGPVGHPRRHEGPLRRHPGRLARLGGRPAGGRSDRLRAPHGRGGAGGARRRAARVLGERRTPDRVTLRPAGAPGRAAQPRVPTPCG